MRDQRRIRETLDILEETWNKYPDLRLIQLLTNITHNVYRPYALEDEDLQDLIKEYGDL